MDTIRCFGETIWFLAIGDFPSPSQKKWLKSCGIRKNIFFAWRVKCHLKHDGMPETCRNNPVVCFKRIWIVFLHYNQRVLPVPRQGSSSTIEIPALVPCEGLKWPKLFVQWKLFVCVYAYMAYILLYIYNIYVYIYNSYTSYAYICIIYIVNIYIYILYIWIMYELYIV
jgi:hypothetical protein